MTSLELRHRRSSMRTISPESLAALANRALETWQVPGLALAMTAGDEVVLAEGFGRTGKGPCVDRETLFAIASCSKPMAAATVAALVRESRCGWHTPVHEILPWFTFPDARYREQVTVEDLLVHRLGIGSSEHRWRPFMRTRRELVERLHLLPMRHPFREGFGYCTDAYTVAGEIVAAITGMPWEAYASQTIWSPLGMLRTNASCEMAREQAASAVPHVVERDRLRPVAWAYEDWAAVPAGGVNSSAAELALWLLAWTATTPRLPWLDGTVASWMLQPVTPIAGAFDEAEFTSFLPSGPGGIESPACSRGWYVHRYRGERIAYHCGRIRGFCALTGLMPDRRVGIALMVNAERSFLPRAVFQTIVDRLVDAPEQDWLGSLQRASDAPAYRSVGSDCPVGEAPEPLAACTGAYCDDGLLGNAQVAVIDGVMHLAIRDFTFALRRIGVLAFRAEQLSGRARMPPFKVTFLEDATRGIAGFETDTGLSFMRN